MITLKSRLPTEVPVFSPIVAAAVAVRGIGRFRKIELWHAVDERIIIAAGFAVERRAHVFELAATLGANQKRPHFHHYELRRETRVRTPAPSSGFATYVRRSDRTP